MESLFLIFILFLMFLFVPIYLWNFKVFTYLEAQTHLSTTMLPSSLIFIVTYFCEIFLFFIFTLNMSQVKPNIFHCWLYEVFKRSLCSEWTNSSSIILIFFHTLFISQIHTWKLHLIMYKNKIQTITTIIINLAKMKTINLFWIDSEWLCWGYLQVMI